MRQRHCESRYKRFTMHLIWRESRDREREREEISWRTVKPRVTCSRVTKGEWKINMILMLCETNSWERERDEKKGKLFFCEETSFHWYTRQREEWIIVLFIVFTVADMCATCETEVKQSERKWESDCSKLREKEIVKETKAERQLTSR